MIEILDGMRDGRSHHKKNLGGAKAMFVPKMTDIAIVYNDSTTVPDVSAAAQGKRAPVKPESYGDMWVIDVKTLKDNQAETLTIGGGSYQLFPVPSIKKMKSLGIK